MFKRTDRQRRRVRQEALARAEVAGWLGEVITAMQDVPKVTVSVVGPPDPEAEGPVAWSLVGSADGGGVAAL